METFAFMIHPISARDVARKYPIARILPDRWIEFALRYKKPMVVSHITGIRSLTGAEAEGWFIGCPLTTRQMATLPLDEVWERIIAAGKLAQETGAKILGLGAHTSVVGDGGITVAKHLDIPVTTGNSYTVATAIEGAVAAAEKMGISVPEASAAVVGATGSIGRTCAQILAGSVRKLALVGRDEPRLARIAEALRAGEPGAQICVSTDIRNSLTDADIIITVTSAVDAVIEPEYLKPGAVVCDVARPRDVSKRVVEERDDVLVIEGGVVLVPGEVDFHFDFGFPPRTAFACMSETMMLALEGRYESFTVGKEVSVEQVRTSQELAARHGCRLAGFRSFERAVTDEHIEWVRRNAERKRRKVG